MVGGYALSALCAIAIAWLPLSRVDATITGMVSSFAIYTAVVLWAFTGREMPDSQGRVSGKAHFRQSMSWLHTWSGLLASWLLFSIFVSGSAAYYRASITDWMQPERLLSVRASTLAAGSDAGSTQGLINTPDIPLAAAQQSVTASAVRRLNEIAPHASRWMIMLPDGTANPAQIKWASDTNKPMQSELVETSTNPAADDISNNIPDNVLDNVLDSAPHSAAERAGPAMTDGVPSRRTAFVEGRATQGGDFFYTFHYSLHYLPTRLGEWIVGAAAMFMMVAMVSGIITHRRIFVDFFTFRPRKGLRSWMDGHIITAVLALPYHLMISYSGLVLLMLTVMPWPVQARYPGPGGALQFYGDAYDYRVPSIPSGKSMPLMPIAPLLQRAQQAFATQLPSVITIDHPGDANATVRFELGMQHRLSAAQETITYSGVSGERMARFDTTPVKTVTGVLMGLHQAVFAPPVIRALFFLSGLSGAVMVASGLVMWAKRYRLKHGQRDAPFGVRLVEHLNVGTIAGMPVAVASYFWANRLLPPLFASRSKWEVKIFFITWGLAFLHPLWRGAYRGCLDQLSLGVALFGLLPLLDWWMIGTWVMPIFDLVSFTLSALLTLTIVYMRRRRPHSPTQARVRGQRAACPA